MKSVIINQFEHFWKNFKAIINDFDEKSWEKLGFGITKPNKLSLHIITATKYYINDTSPIIYRNGKSFDFDVEKLDEINLPTMNDINSLITEMQNKTVSCIQNLDFEAENTEFDYTGKTKLSVVLFLLRHSQFHLGEISSLLNEFKKGKAKDHWCKTL